MDTVISRINYKGDIKRLLSQVCDDYGIGRYVDHEPVIVGYEDCNLVLTTNLGKYFVKIFGSFRDRAECQRYVSIIEHALQSGVSHPALIAHSKGNLYQYWTNDTTDYLCLMEDIDGKMLFDQEGAPSREDISFVAKQAALINNINLRPEFIYDHWAISSFEQEYEAKRPYLSQEDQDLLALMPKLFRRLNTDSLPHALVHGDLIKTNIMKRTDGRIFVVDFAVANYLPRIQELAVLLCDFCFDPTSPERSKKYHDILISEYRKHLELTGEELEKLPGYLKLAHAMHLLSANYEKVVNKNDSPENEYFLKLGRAGLKQE
jgi:homoserine kinase type II